MTIKEYLNPLKVLVPIIAAIVILTPGWSFADSYGAFGNYTLGSARVLGLGGAYTALSSDSNAFFYNPAATAQSELDLQFEAATNRLENHELDLNRSSFSESLTNQFQMVGAHYKSGSFSVGLGYVVPYFVEMKNSMLGTSKSLKVQEAGLNVSYGWFKSLYFGVNVKYSEAHQMEVLPAATTGNAVENYLLAMGFIVPKKSLGFGIFFFA